MEKFSSGSETASAGERSSLLPTAATTGPSLPLPLIQSLPPALVWHQGLPGHGDPTQSEQKELVSALPTHPGRGGRCQSVGFNVNGHPSCPTVKAAASGVPGQSLRQPLRDLSLSLTHTDTQSICPHLFQEHVTITSLPVYLPPSNRDSTVNNSEKYV